MFLGDDDFIEEEYIINILKKIESSEKISMIIPDFIPITIDNKILGKSRDWKQNSKIYLKGFRSCLKNSWSGHQMSGLVFKRKGVIELYKKNKVNNLYPFIYITSISILNGNIWHYVDYPIKVTQPGQEKKDWTYGKDGLVSEIFDNYKKIENINKFQRFLLEMQLLRIQKSRYLGYKKNAFFAVWNIVKNKNTSKLTKIIFPIYLLLIFPILTVKKLGKKICR